ncbi:MAG: hypothetical protein C5B46_05390 [Proteobacteria bacterium]|nr:MAG: hypothetical protein C5B46_05390 [Pseudomonadota bacterium]
MRAFRLSGALWDRGPGFDARVVLELAALHRIRIAACLPAFLRELSKPIELFALCQTLFFVSFRGRPDSLPAVIPRRNEPNRMTSKSLRISIFRAAQIFQTATSNAQATKARGRSSRVMQWLVLCGIPYRGPGVQIDLT